MPRILHIIPSLARSGTTRQLAVLAAGLPRQEFDVHVAALSNGGPAADDFRGRSIEPFIISQRWRCDPIAIWRLRRLIGRLKPDLVHTWLFDSNTVGRIAALLAGVRGIVATEQSIDIWKTDLELAVDRHLARRTSRIVTNSCAVRQFYLSRGLPPEKSIVIQSGVSPALSPATDRNDLLMQLMLPANAKLIAYVGSLIYRKRLKELIWATDQLKAIGIPAHLLMIGEGPQRQSLERYRWLNRVPERVHFLGSRNDVPQLLARIDVLWQPGANEGQSIAILEAMAAGVPVVAADAGGNRELVIPGRTGYLVPTTERAGFARWTLPLLENSTLARRLGIAGQQRVAKFHRQDEMISRYSAMYREILT